MEDLNAIKTKLRKLQKLYDGAKAINSEGEAQAAAAAIQRIMTQYNLTMAELSTDIQVDDGIIEHACSGFTYKSIGGYWEYRLASVLCKYNFCKCFMHGNSYKKLLIFGKKENVEMVNWMREMLSERFVEFSKKRFKEYQQTSAYAFHPIGKDKYQRSYLMGVVDGLDQKLKEEQNKDKQMDETYGTKITALVVRTDAEITNFVNQKYGGARSGRSMRVNWDAARNSGVADGRNTQIYKPIREANKSAVNGVKLLK